MESDTAARFLRLATTATNLAPPLRSVTDTVLEIATLVVRFKTCTSEWTEFRAYIKGAIAAAIQSVESTNLEQSDAKVHVEKLLSTLKGIISRIKAKQSDPVWVQLRHFLDHPTMIAEMRQQIDDVVGQFKLGTAIRTELKTEKILLQLAEKQHTVDPLLGKLQYMRGASWDPSRVCLPETRLSIIESVLSWVNAPPDTCNTNIFLLTGVAGAGKSAISHTVLQRLFESKQLLTSFFFDRETAERNNPKYLISTLATDMASRDNVLATRIISAIQNDESLIGAPITQQFQDLIFGPSAGCDYKRPLVIVLDALDEGCNIDLLKILGKRASQLPQCVRIFLTSRMTPNMEKLRCKSHVHSASLDIYTEENTSDISIYVPYKLKQVAEEQLLGDDWPDSQLVYSFQAKAGGLFLWVTTMCDYLSTCYNAQRELELLVSSYHSGSSAKSKMDNLYITILRTFNWEDEEFSNSCRALLGAVVAAKSPLTLRALNALYQRVIMESERALRQLSPLLTGLSNELTDQPVRFLHSSLRDFLTLQAASPDGPTNSQMFAVEEREHSCTLAFLCLILMNKKLDLSIPGVGYCLNSVVQSSGIPSIRERNVPEELMYACRFWVEHLLDTETPMAAELVGQLEQFLSCNITLWIELVATYGRYEGLSRLHQWVQNELSLHPSLKHLVFSQNLAHLVHDLAKRLRHMDQREEALLAAQDEIAIFWNLVAQDNSSVAALARALSASVPYLRDLNQPDEAIAVASEAIDVQRDLSLTNSAGDLAHSLYQLSAAYRDLKRPDDAIKAAEEAVQLQQSLPPNDQVTSMQDSNLALYLHGHAVCFSDMGRHEDSLLAIQRAVELCRQFASEQSPEYTLDLASSLHSLAGLLVDLGRYVEALSTAEEAIRLRQQIAKERPSGMGELANSLERFSLALSRVC